MFVSLWQRRVVAKTSIWKKWLLGRVNGNLETQNKNSRKIVKFDSVSEQCVVKIQTKNCGEGGVNCMLNDFFFSSSFKYNSLYWLYVPWFCTWLFMGSYWVFSLPLCIPRCLYHYNLVRFLCFQDRQMEIYQ